MILYIDTKDQKQVKVEIRDKALPAGRQGKVISELSAENQYGSQVLLPLIIKLLQSYKPGLKTGLQTVGSSHVWFAKLKAIEVETGPGSFTGLRVGVSVANALGFALGIPVNGKKIETNLQY